ncbi:unnamed protein product [Rotaria sp. Silwood2]|nr:unnamed protein product [Rotaria sp. Silwood2]
MADKTVFGENMAVNIPLQLADENETKMDTDPPLYETPQVDFSSGWKDRGFAIAFWIHTIAVILVGLILGAPIVFSIVRNIEFNSLEQSSVNLNIKVYLFGLGAAGVAGGLASIITLFFLQACAGQVIKCAFLIIIMAHVMLVVIFFFVFFPLCFIPGFFLVMILIYLSCIRKRISFAEAHLQAGCASLRSQPSLILVAVLMLIVEFLWFVFWLLMVIGMHRTFMSSTSTSSLNGNTSLTNTTAFNLSSSTPARMMTTKLVNGSKKKLFNGTSSGMREKQISVSKNMNSTDRRFEDNNITRNSTSEAPQWYSSYINDIIYFFMMLSWYWGAVTFGNIAHFIVACAVGRWWFSTESNEQYSTGNSINRAFTTNFGTICMGSLFEAIIKALRSTANKNRQKSVIACVLGWILGIIEKVVGYLNEWAFIFAALTGQGFVEASRSFIELFKKRGWTAIINDAVIGTTLSLINFIVGLISATAGGLLVYFMTNKSPEQIIASIIVAIISLFIGIFMSSIITTILISCVRTVFVCFALNPAVLGATHPDHLQKLSKVWHKFYPQEYATSGYANHLNEPMV